MVLVKSESLKALIGTGLENKSIREIIALFWEAREISSFLSPADFEIFPFAELKKVNYATISCTEDIKWNSLAEFIFGINGVQTELLFLDALCIDHSNGDQKKFLKQRSIIFEHSSEHHIIEFSCLYYSETWYDLSFINRERRPIVHDSDFDAVGNNIMLNHLKSKGFESVYTASAEEVDMKELVRASIVSRWGSMETFIGRVRDTVVNAMELSQVRVVVHSYTFCCLNR